MCFDFRWAYHHDEPKTRKVFTLPSAQDCNLATPAAQDQCPTTQSTQDVVSAGHSAKDEKPAMQSFQEQDSATRPGQTLPAWQMAQHQAIVTPASSEEYVIHDMENYDLTGFSGMISYITQFFKLIRYNTGKCYVFV
jgi:hypothetical protein